MSILNGIIKRWNKNTEIYDTIHPETEHAQVVDFGEGTVMHLLATTLANTVEAVSTDSLFGKLVSKLLDATGVQYNFSSSNAWYICFGSLLGGLIIQGGRSWNAYNSNATLPLSLNTLMVVIGCHYTDDRDTPAERAFSFSAGKYSGSGFWMSFNQPSTTAAAAYVAIGK